MDDHVRAALAPLGAELVDVESPHVEADGCSRCVVLEARVERLIAVIRDQARALAEITDECPPWAPSLAIVYWKYGPTRWHEPSWDEIFWRLAPLISRIGDLPAAKLTPTVWAEHRSFRKAQAGRWGKPVGDTTLNIELGRAKEMLSWATKEGMVRFNPLADAKRVKAISQRDTALSTDEMAALLAAVDDVVDERLLEGDDDGRRAKLLHAFILAQYDSMLRPGEARGLRLERIQSDGTVELQARSTKSKRGRAIILTPRTLEAIRDIHGNARIGPVFAWADGAEVSKSALKYWFTRARTIAGVQAAPGDRHVQQRDMRASGATEADRRGARAVAIRDTLGHADLQTTQRYLRTSLAENARHVADVMGNRTGPKQSPRRSAHKSTRRM